MSLNYIQRSSPSPSKAHRESARSLKETWEHCCYQTWQRFWNCSHGQIWICPSSKRSFYRWIGNATKFARIDDKRPKRGGAAHRKVKWMNVVSLWGVNCRFRSQLGCLRCKVTICPSRYRLVLCIKKFSKNALTLTTQKSPLGVSLNLSHAHIGSPSGDLIWIASSSLLDGSPPYAQTFVDDPEPLSPTSSEIERCTFNPTLNTAWRHCHFPFFLSHLYGLPKTHKVKKNWVWDQFYPPPELTTLTWLIGLKKLIETTFCKLVRYYCCIWICWWDLFHSFEWRRYTGLLWREGPFSNIPLSETINILVDKAFTNDLNLEKQELTQLFDVAATNQLLRFDGHLYE